MKHISEFPLGDHLPLKKRWSTGWPKLDEITGGLRPGQTWVFSSEDYRPDPLGLAYQVLLGAASSPQRISCLLLSTTVTGEIVVRNLFGIYKAMCEMHVAAGRERKLPLFEKLAIYIDDSAYHDKTWMMDNWLCDPIVHEGIRIVMVDDWNALLDSESNAHGTYGGIMHRAQNACRWYRDLTALLVLPEHPSQTDSMEDTGLEGMNRKPWWLRPERHPLVRCADVHIYCQGERVFSVEDEEKAKKAGYDQFKIFVDKNRLGRYGFIEAKRKRELRWDEGVCIEEAPRDPIDMGM